MGIFTKSSPQRVDMETPLGIRIGSTVNFNLIGKMNTEKSFPDLEFKFPENLTVFVRYYGTIKKSGYVMHRFYLAPMITDEDPTWVLQIVTSLEGDLVDDECKLFERKSVITPGSEEEWQVWIDDRPDESSIIGYEIFEDASADNLIYYRDTTWGNGVQIDPICMSETVYRDEHGNESDRLKHQLMFYGRHSSSYDDFAENIPDDAPVEWCIVSAVEDDDGAWVEISKGISIDPADFRINA